METKDNLIQAMSEKQNEVTTVPLKSKKVL